MEKFSILYVDDEEINLRIFKNTFRREYNVFTALSANEGLDILDKERIDLVLSDQRMPEVTGVEFLKMTLERHPKPNRILITAYTDFEALQKAINEARIFQYVQKPWNEDYLKEVIRNALELYLLKKENIKLNNQLLQKNKQLEKLNDDLLELDKLKTDFLSIISHEIRTPLNSLIAPFQLLKEEVSASTSDSLKTYIKILDNSVSRLEKFALNAERITRLKAKKYKLNIEAVVVIKTINNVLSLFKDDIKNKNINLVLNLSDNYYIKGDFKLFEFCIEKLIENSVKYTDIDGTIEIIATEDDSSKIIAIQDTGKGFSDKAMEYLFQIFSSVNHTDKNMGVDLAMVNLIMQTHQGKITVENNEKGALVKLFFNKSFIEN